MQVGPVGLVEYNPAARVHVQMRWATPFPKEGDGV